MTQETVAKFQLCNSLLYISFLKSHISKAFSNRLPTIMHKPLQHSPHSFHKGGFPYPAAVISGKPGNLFDQLGDASRGELAVIFYRFIPLPPLQDTTWQTIP